jgi:YegS/Rv2252/BmrU family lipid kinase
MTYSLPRMLLVINPTSASGSTQHNLDLVRRELRAHRISFDEHMTRCRGDATLATRYAFAGGESRVIAVGGDGTLNEVVSGYFDASGQPINNEGAIGLLPSGTGSDFRRSLGFATITEAAQALARDRVHSVDVGRATFRSATGEEETRSFVNAASFGLGGMTAARVNSWRSVFPTWVGGQPRFVLAALGALWDYENRPVQIVLDSTRRIEVSSNLIVVSNGRYAGSGMKLAPLAEFDDGLLDVLIADGVSRAGIIREMTRVWDGQHLQNPQIIMLKARTIEVSADPQLKIELDGEAVGITPVSITLQASALRFIV